VSKKNAKKKSAKKSKAGASPSTGTAKLRVADPAAGVERVLVITAHPDDVDFAAAGTVAKMTAAGVEVTYCLVTDGDAGGSDLSSTAEQRASLRQAEQRIAASKVGVTSLIFLGHLDGQVEANLALRKDLSRVIRKVRPDRVLCQSPLLNMDRIYASHPDHLAAGQAAIAAVYPDARNPFSYPELLNDEGLEPHAVPEIWVMAMVDPNVVVDTTDVVAQKIEALASHESQVGDGAHLKDLITNWGQMVAQAAGMPKGRLAEAFRIIDTK
jgi:LmbE family N-acetylglucosaminyl deacetylase